MSKASVAIQWTIATTVAIVLGGLALSTVGSAFPYVAGLVLGIPLAIAQWLVLRRLEGSRSWIPATVIGFGFMWLIGFAFAALKGSDALRVFFAFAAATPILGAAQARVLRRWTKGAAWWIVASTLGWTTFFATIEWMPGTGPIELLLGGAAAGLITGAALTQLVPASLGSEVVAANTAE